MNYSLRSTIILAFSLSPISDAASETLSADDLLQKITSAAETCIEKSSRLDEANDGAKSKISALSSRSMMDFYFRKSIKEQALTKEIEDVYSNLGAKCYELVDGEEYFWHSEKMKLLSKEESEDAIRSAKLESQRLELEAEAVARKTEAFLARAMACRRLYRADQDAALLHDGCYDFFTQYGLPKNKPDQ